MRPLHYVLAAATFAVGTVYGFRLGYIAVAQDLLSSTYDETDEFVETQRRMAGLQ